MISYIIYRIVSLLPNFTYRIINLISTHYTSLLIPFLTSKQLSLNIKYIYDIGANKGLWSKS